MKVFSVLDIGKRQVLSGTVSTNELGRTIFNKKDEDGVIARMDTNAALCDFAGPGRTLFQVTVSDQHTVSKQGLEELLISSGHVHRVDNTIEKSKGAEHIGMINLYWIIPPSQLEHWKSKVPETIRKRTSELFHRH